MLDNALSEMFCADEHLAVFDGGQDRTAPPVDVYVKMQMLQKRIRDREQRRKMFEDGNDGDNADETWVLQLLEESGEEQQMVDHFNIEHDDSALLEDQTAITCADDPAQILEIDWPPHFLLGMTAIEAQIIARAEQLKRERLVAEQSKRRTVWLSIKTLGAHIFKSRKIKA